MGQDPFASADVLCVPLMASLGNQVASPAECLWNLTDRLSGSHVSPPLGLTRCSPEVLCSCPPKLL